MQIRKVAVATFSVALTVTLAFSLSACGSGNNAQTRAENQLTDGVDGSITAMGNAIKARSILLVAQSDGSAVVVGTIVNDGATEDTLLALAANQIVATLSQKELALKQNAPVIFSGTSSNASAVIAGLNAQPGTRVKVQMFFANAGELTLDAMVVERSGTYAGVGA